MSAPDSIDALNPAPAVAEAQTVLILVDVAPRHRAWGLQRYVLGAWPLRGTPGLRLTKVLGSGHEGGFGLRPSGSRQGLLCLFDTPLQAAGFLQDSSLVQDYRRHASEFLSVRLRTTSCRGSWSGISLPVAAPAVADRVVRPMAALTRASIRPRTASAFWKLAPAAQRSLERADGCRLAVGLGEAPLLRQATFSVWESAEAMERYARGGAHQEAVAQAYQQDFFSESMFARFEVQAIEGCWKGREWPAALRPQPGEPPLFRAAEPARADLEQTVDA
jgi:heme-degrading monooxygenase HmoA